MAKVKIIDSYSLECLISGLHSEIEEADTQIVVYQNEVKRENQHRQNDETIERARKAICDWVVRRNVLHQCLCKIQLQIKEIEI